MPAPAPRSRLRPPSPPERWRHLLGLLRRDDGAGGDLPCTAPGCWVVEDANASLAKSRKIVRRRGNTKAAGALHGLIDGGWPIAEAERAHGAFAGRQPASPSTTPNTPRPSPRAWIKAATPPRGDFRPSGLVGRDAASPPAHQIRSSCTKAFESATRHRTQKGAAANCCSRGQLGQVQADQPQQEHGGIMPIRVAGADRAPRRSHRCSSPRLIDRNQNSRRSQGSPAVTSKSVRPITHRAVGADRTIALRSFGVGTATSARAVRGGNPPFLLSACCRRLSLLPSQLPAFRCELTLHIVKCPHTHYMCIAHAVQKQPPCRFGLREGT